MIKPFKPFRPRAKTKPAPFPTAIREGDRIAFITLGANPRTLCAVVTEASVRDGRGRTMHRVKAAGRTYLARPGALCKLPNRKDR